jgi:hypothetical protein
MSARAETIADFGLPSVESIVARAMTLEALADRIERGET